MDLYLQFGWGMMEHCRNLIREWGEGTAILSPRDLKEAQLIRLSEELRSLGGSVLLDPQFYLPRSDHHRLIQHRYWPQNYDTSDFDYNGRSEMIRVLAEINNELETSHFIIPGERAEVVNDLWLESQRNFYETAREITDKPLIMTICLSGQAIRSSDQINLVMEQVEQASVVGYYIVAERPGYAYLVDDPQWLFNTIDLAAGLKRLGGKVIVGYSNQQQLIMACAKVDAISSGTWVNVRSFFPDKFRNNYEEEIKRRTIWYYCPQALSEITLPFLDIGYRAGLRDALFPNPPTPYAIPIFESTQPSASGWSEADAFRHFLMALKQQIQDSTRGSFDETVTTHQTFLDNAEEMLRSFKACGLFCGNRDFQVALDANRSCLVNLQRTHGPLLRRMWGEL